MGNEALIRKTLAEGEGVFRLNPVFVPRQFGKAGRRLKLHPDDVHARVVVAEGVAGDAGGAGGGAGREGHSPSPPSAGAKEPASSGLTVR